MPLASPDPDAEYTAMGIGAVCALPPLVIYLWIPRLIDRFDPEPWWALALVLGWGAIAACGVAATLNTGAELVANAIGGKEFAQVAGACISAPIVEEGMKGLAVFGVFYFLQREFDGVVDGVIYATFVALGFAATENIIYYGNAVKADPQGSALAATFVIRGVLAPWGHPLYTSMTGIGFGIARETNRTWLKWMAPLVRLLRGDVPALRVEHGVDHQRVPLPGHAAARGSSSWLAFIGILIWLVVRKGRIIRMHLQDEVLLGTITREELEPHMFARGRAAGVVRLGRQPRAAGSCGRRRASGLSKWHAGRAMRGRKKTVSADWIVPLRQELAELRMEVARSMGRAVPMPQAWAPPGQGCTRKARRRRTRSKAAIRRGQLRRASRSRPRHRTTSTRRTGGGGARDRGGSRERMLASAIPCSMPVSF